MIENVNLKRNAKYFNEIIPNKSILRDLNTDIYLIEQVHRDPLLLLPQEEDTLLRELVVIELNTLCCLLHGYYSESFLLLLLQGKYKYLLTDSHVGWIHLKEIGQFVRLAFLEGNPVLRSHRDSRELFVLDHSHGREDQTAHPQDLTSPAQSPQVGGFVYQAGHHHQVRVGSALVL